MDDKALQISFELFASKGYNGTIEDYSTLIKENEEALNISHQLFSQNGYNGSIEDYSKLVGLGKKQGPATNVPAVGPLTAEELVFMPSDTSLGFKKIAETEINENEEFDSIATELEAWKPIEELPRVKKQVYEPSMNRLRETEDIVFPEGYNEYLEKADGNLDKAKVLYFRDKKNSKLLSEFENPEKGTKMFDIKNTLVSSFKNNLQEIPKEEKTEALTLNYKDVDQVKEFNSKVVKDYISKDKDIQERIIPKSIEEIKNSKEFKNKINEVRERFKSGNYTQLDVDMAEGEINDFLQRELSSKVSRNKDFKAIMEKVSLSLDRIHEKQNKFYLREQNTPDILKGNIYTERLYASVDNMLTSYAKGSIYYHVEAYNNTKEFYKNTLRAADREGWDDNKKGYLVKGDQKKDFGSAARFIPEGQYVPPGAEPIVWGEAKSKLSDIINNREKDIVDKLDYFAEKAAISDAYEMGSFEKMIASKDSAKQLGLMLADQLPQMTSAIVSFGLLPSFQAGSSIMYDSLLKEARDKYKIPETEIPSVDQISEVFKEKGDSIAAKSVAAGLVSGGLEGIGAGKALKGLTALKEVGGSLLKGQFKNVLKSSIGYGVEALEGGLTEGLTEILQTAVEDITIGNDPEFRNYLEAGGTGFTLGLLFPIVGGSVRQVTTEAKTAYAKLNSKSYTAFLMRMEDQIELDFKNDKDEKAYKAKIASLEVFKKLQSSIFDGVSKKSRLKLYEPLLKVQTLQTQLAQGRDYLSKEAKAELNEKLETAKAELNTIAVAEAKKDIQAKNKKDIATSKDIYDNIEVETIDDTSSGELANVGVTGEGSIIVRLNEATQAESLGLRGKKGSAALTAMRHEALHPILSILGLANPQIRSQLTSYIRKFVKDGDKVAAAYNQRLDKYQARYEAKWEATWELAEQMYPNAEENVIDEAVNKATKQDQLAVYEESMTVLLDIIENKETRLKNKYLLKRIADWFKITAQRLGLKKIKLDTVDDLYNFVKLYSKTYDSKTGIGKAVLKDIAKYGIDSERIKSVSKDFVGEVAGLQTISKKSIDSEMFALEDKLNAGEISMEQYDAEMDRLIAAIEKQEKQIEEKEDFEVKKTPVKKKREKSDLEIELAGKAKKHKEILDGIGNNPDGYNPNDPKLWETLESMITSKARNFTTAKGDYAPLTNLPGFDMESMVAETQANMINYIKKFDPSLNNSLYGYINAQLQNRMRAALKTGRVAGAEFTTDVTEAKGVIADNNGYVEVTKPGYVSISDSKSFSEDLIEKAKVDLLRVVRVLKSKIDTPMTVNQSISPLMREIIQGTKNMMDAAIKAEMGGKKDGKLRNWLIANKKTVIENSTTTFLMGKDAKTGVKGGIPQAIQKQINGKWVSYPEWVGKIPDRETTWARGNTAGNYIVRRVPADQVSDADFVSQVLNPNGNPIPGRKEAIAMHLSSELSVELFIKELKDENSDISKAFETNRELRDEILADNFISELNKQAERGLVKHSISDALNEGESLLEQLKDSGLIDEDGLKRLEKIVTDKNTKDNLFNVYSILLDHLNPEVSSKDLARLFLLNATSIINPTSAEAFFKAVNKAAEYYKYQKALVSITNKLKEIVGIDDEEKLKKELAGFFNNLNRGSRNLYRYGFRTNENIYNHINSLLIASGKKTLKDLGFKLEGTKNKIIEFDGKINFKYTDLSLTRVEKSATIEEVMSVIDEYNSAYPDIRDTAIEYIVSNRSEKDIYGILQTMRIHMDSPLRRGVRITFIEKEIEKLSDLTVEHGDRTQAFVDDIFKTVKKFKNNKAKLEENLKILFDKQNAGFISKELEKTLSKDGDFKSRYKEASVVKIEPLTLVSSSRTASLKEPIISAPPARLTQNMSEADINKEFNKILERKSGIKAGKKISESAAANLGKNKGKFKFFLPPNAEDFVGLLYSFLGKGKQGDADFQFFKELLIDPFNEAEQKMSEFRQDLSKDIKSINKEIGKISTIVDKKTVKELDELGYSPEQAVRIYIWSRRGEDIPNITRVERTKVNLILGKDRKLANYANHVMKITDKYGGYPPPSKHWFGGNLTTDFYEYANNNVRQELLETWQGNIDVLFNSENLSKLRAIYGKDFVKNLNLTIKRMKSGVNKFHSEESLSQSAIDFVNGSVGVIMFLNMRSAALQTISAVNFINWTDNNPIAAAKALSNPKEYASMFLKLLNSDFLKQRRDGLELNISEAEIADAATNAKNFFNRLYHKTIKIGYTPTQFADSFAIALGGTSFVMNRIKTYEKEGFSQSEAYEKAYNDFREIAEENQQSSRTDKISNIQSSSFLSRLIFAFNNTPFQYTRIIKKAALDLANGRGDWKTNLSKIIYYGAVQNAIFYTLQQALFRTMFDDDEEEVTKTELKLLNNMADSLLRGSGLPGAIVSMIKNVIIKAKEEEQKGWKGSPEKVALELTSISPPLSYKFKKAAASVRSYKYAEKDYDKIRAAARMGSVVNLPVDRMLTKYENLTTAMSNDVDNWMRFALVAGWGKYELGLYDKNKKKAKKTNNAIKTLKIKPIKVKPIKVK